MIDKVLLASLPSYDLSIGDGLIFNSTTDVGEDESVFLVSRLKMADAVRERSKIDTVCDTVVCSCWTAEHTSTVTTKTLLNLHATVGIFCRETVSVT